jgi:HEAT repeat protein
LIKVLNFGWAVEEEKPHKKKEEELSEDGDPLQSEVRSWGTTALSELSKLTKTSDKIVRQAVIKCLMRETGPTSRYWMLLAAYEMSTPQGELKPVVEAIARKYRQGVASKKFEETFDSLDELNERAAPLAIAIQANWGDAGAVDCLEILLKSAQFGLMWSACRALEVVGVRELLNILTEVASDRRTWPDIRNRCIAAIGAIESPAAAHALSGLLATERDPILRESVIQGLVNLGTNKSVRALIEKSSKKEKSSYSIADSLVPALLDENAQIRHRTAQALLKVIGDLIDDEQDDEKKKIADENARKGASERIVAELIREKVDVKDGVPKLVDALRAVDPPEANIASTVLNRYLFDEDLSIKQRAQNALRLLGGERAVQTLASQRSEVLAAYNNLLTKADEPIQKLFEDTMAQARQSFLISQIMSIVVFVVGIGAIITGLWFAFTGEAGTTESIFGAGTTIIGVIAVLLDLMVRDPHKRVQEATSVLLRIKVIFLGYLRQIHQIDATFKHEFIEGGSDFGHKDVEQTTRLINEVMNTTMTSIGQNLPIRKTEQLAVDETLKKWKESLKPIVENAAKGDAPKKDEETDADGGQGQG